MRENSTKRVDTTNWLSATLSSYKEEQENTSDVRAYKAFRIRAKRRFGSFVKKAETPQELESRVSLIEEGLRACAKEVCQEYGASSYEDLYQRARLAAGEFFGEPGEWTPAEVQLPQNNPEEVCPHCGFPKPVGGPCPHCGAPSEATGVQGIPVGGEGAGISQGMPTTVAAKKPKGHKDECGCWACDLASSTSEGPGGGPFNFDADEGANTAEGEAYDEEQEGRQQGGHKGSAKTADIEGGTYQYQSVDPNKEMNDAVSMAEGPSYPHGTIEKALDSPAPSKDHPHEIVHPLDFEAPTNSDPEIQRAVKTIDPQKSPSKDIVGEGGTFGTSPRAQKPVTKTPTTTSSFISLSRWIIL